MSTTRRFRVASPQMQEIHTGASFLPGEEAPGFDPSDPYDAAKLEEGLFVEIQGVEQPPSAAVVRKAEELGVDLADVKPTGKRGITVADVVRTHENQEASK